MAAITSAASAVVARPAFVGKTESLRARAVAPAAPKRASVVTFASAEETSRRAALSTFTVSARTPIHIATGVGRHDRSASRGKRAPRPRRRRSSRARVRTTTDDVVTGKQTLRIATATREISRRAIGALPVTPAYRSTLDSSPNLRPPVSRSPRSPPWPRTVTPPTSGVPPPTPPVRPRETQKVTTGTDATISICPRRIESLSEPTRARARTASPRARSTAVTSPSSQRESRDGCRARALASPVARRFRTRHERDCFGTSRRHFFFFLGETRSGQIFFPRVFSPGR